MALYSAGNPPTIAMLDPADVIRFQDKALDLKDEKWVQDAIDRNLDRITLPNGKLLGFPFAVEGYGLIYNRQVVEQATNGKFDPATIRTTADLEALFKKIEADREQRDRDFALGLVVGPSLFSNLLCHPIR